MTKGTPPASTNMRRRREVHVNLGLVGDESGGAHACGEASAGCRGRGSDVKEGRGERHQRGDGRIRRGPAREVHNPGRRRLGGTTPRQRRGSIRRRPPANPSPPLKRIVEEDRTWRERLSHGDVTGEQRAKTSLATCSAFHHSPHRFVITV
jgi:hypothetical protein